MRFKDRTDAGRRLAAMLAERYEGQDGIVYALPRGGVVVAAEVAHRLAMPLDVIIARKIGHPYNPEYAIGALTETDEPVTNRQEVAQVEPEWFERHVAAERLEARRRRERYVGGRLPLPATGKLAIVVDDGVATGLTIEAAIRALRTQRPKRLVVAVPAAPPDIAAKLRAEADELVAVDISDDDFGAVGAFYHDFAPVSDEEVVQTLRTANAAPTPRRR